MKKHHHSVKPEFNTRSSSYRTMPVAMITGSGSNNGGSGVGSLGEHSIDPVEIWGSGGDDNQGDLANQMSYLDSIFGGSGGNNDLIGTSFESSGSSESDGNESVNRYQYYNMVCEMTCIQFTIVKPSLDKLPMWLKSLKPTIKIGPTKGNVPAQYISSTNTVILNEQYVNSGNYDDFDSVLEEFLHAIQDIWFKEKGINMSKQSRSAVEFEAKVMKWLYETAMLELTKIPEGLINWINKCLVDLTNSNGYDWSLFDYDAFYDNYLKYYNLFVKYYESNKEDDIGNYSDGDYMFWDDHWNYYFEQMKIIFNGNNGFGSTVIITVGSGNGSASYLDAGSY